MSDDNSTAGQNGAQPAVRLQILTQYIRDL
jgi:hypothetical protein